MRQLPACFAHCHWDEQPDLDWEDFKDTLYKETRDQPLKSGQRTAEAVQEVPPERPDFSFGHSYIALLDGKGTAELSAS